MSTGPRVLLVRVDNESALGNTNGALGGALAGDVQECQGLALARTILQDAPAFDVIVLHCESPQDAALIWLRDITGVWARPPVVLLTAPEHALWAADALGAGATNYVFSDTAGAHAPLLCAAITAATRTRSRDTAARADRPHLRDAVYDFLIEQSPVLLLCIDTEQRLLTVSESWLQRLGYARPEVIGRPVTDFLVESTRQAAADGIAALLQSGGTTTSTRSFQAKDGSVVDVHVSAMTVDDAQGRPVRAIALLQDVTQQKAAEAQLSDAREQLRAVVDNLPVVLMAMDTQGVVTVMEGTGLHALGLDSQNCVGKSLLDELAVAETRDGEPQAAQIANCVHQALAGNTSVERVGFGGRLLEVRFGPMRTDDGLVQGAIAVAADVTDQAESEQARVAAEERLETVVANAPVLLFAVDAEGGITVLQGKALEGLGGDPKAALGLSIFDVFAENPQVLTNVRRALDGEEFTDMVSAGDLVFATRYSPVRNAAGAVTGLIGVATDQTERYRAEQALRASEERYRLLTEHISDVIWALDSEGLLTYASPAIERVLGYSTGEMIGRPFSALIAPDALDVAMTLFAQAVSGELDEMLFESILVRKDSTQLPVEISVTAVRNADGRLQAIQGVARDISERQAAEAALRASEERHRLVTERVSDVIWGLDAEARFTYASPAVEAMLGYAPDELLGVSVLDISAPAAQSAMADVIAEGVRGDRQEVLFESVLRTKAGQDCPVEISAVVVRDAEGGLTGMQGVTRDISERHAAQAALRRSEERYRVLAERSHDAIWIADARGNFTYVSPAIERILGLKPDDLVGTPIMRVLASKDAVQMVTGLEAAAQSGEMDDLVIELPIRDQAGNAVWCEVTTVFLRDADGHIASMQGVTRDISERQAAEAAVRQSEERFRILVDSAPVGVCACDTAGTITTVNNELVRILGAPSADAVKAFKIYEGEGLLESGAIDWARDAASIVDGSPRAVQYTSAWGKNVHALVRIAPLRDAEGRFTGGQAIVEDMTERQQALHALRESEHRYRALIEQAGDGILIADNAGRALEINAQGAEILGCTQDEFVGLDVPALIHPDDLAAQPLRLDDVRAGTAVRMERRMRRKDGTYVPTELSARVLEDGRLLAVIRDISDRKAAENAMRESQQRYQLLADNAADIIWVTGPDGLYTYISPSMESQLGYPSDEWIGRSWMEGPLIGDGQMTALNALRDMLNSDDDEFMIEGEHVSKSGAIVWCEIRASQVRDSEGNVTGIMGVTRDITERRTAEEALRDSQERYQLLADSAVDIIWVTDPEGLYTYLSPSLERQLGFAPEEWVGRAWTEGPLTADGQLAAANALRAATETGDGAFFFEGTQHAKNGAIEWCEIRASVLRDSTGNVAGIMGVTRDITERKTAEKALRDSEARLGRAQAVAHLGNWHLDLRTDALTWSEECYNIFALARADFDGTYQGFMQVVHPDDRAAIENAMKTSLSTGMPYNLDHRVVRPDGTIRWVHEQGEVVYDDAGTPIGGMGTVQDITERKEAEEALRESEERHRLVAEHVQDIIWAIGPDMRYSYISPSITKLLGYTQEEIVGNDWTSILTPDAFEQASVLLADSMAGGQKEVCFEAELVRAGGSTLWCEISAVIGLTSDGSLQAIHGVTRDISERREAEEALRQSEERHRLLAEHSQDMIWAMDLDGIFTYASPAVEPIRGFTPEEMVGRSFSERLDPESVQQADTLLAGVRAGKIDDVCFEAATLTKSGESIWCEIRGVVIKDEAGKPIAVQGVTRDISERKQAEEEREQLEAQIQHAQKLESLGVLSGGIAHDFNNLLVGMLGNAGLALMDLPPESPARETIERIEVSAQRAADLTNQLLAYSGKGRFVVQPLNLSALVEEMGHLLQTVISKKALLKCNFAPELPAIEGDATQLRQVIMNLITNASDACGEENGVISVRTSVADLDRAYLSQTYLDQDLPEGRYVCLEVSDTGCGMDQATQDKIFDPFFTTKFTGRGLGLAAVLGIIRGHHGAMKVYSEPGRGTAFKVLIPAIEQPAVPVAKTASTGAGEGGQATILVADDEPNVLDVARAVLERAGYMVLTVADGQSAVEVYRAHQADVSLVLLDMTMPNMSGEEVFAELRRMDPAVRVVLSSGYSEQDVTDQFAGDEISGFIQKPYRPQRLLDEIRGALQAQ